MKLARLCLIAVILATGITFAQQADSTSKSTPQPQITAQKQITQSLPKQTNIIPKPTTNWSKIKDLFE